MGLNGWSTCNASKVGAYRVPGTDVTLMLRREVAPLLVAAAAAWHRTVEPLKKGWCWGYSCRTVRGRSTPSYHSAGLAIDLQAPKHPLGAAPSKSFTPRQIATIRAIAKRYHLRWGGDYRGRKDGMHLEHLGTPAQAKAYVAQLQAKPKPAAAAAAKAAPKKVTAPRLSMLKYGAKNSDIVKMQTQLEHRGYDVGAIDGAYGPGTRRAVQRFQRAQGWSGKDADGIVGPVTLARLFA